MKLLLRRSQRGGGLLGGKILFGLDARLEPTAEESDLIRKYKLGPAVVYSSEDARRHVGAVQDNLATDSWAGVAKAWMHAGLSRLALVCSIDSLMRGQNIECKDLGELLDAEAAIVTACQNAKNFLQVATTFDGREDVIEV